MRKSNDLARALEIIRALSQSERDVIVSEIVDGMGGKMPVALQARDESHCETIVVEGHSHRPNCPHCGAKSELGYIVKDGRHHGAQRYKCKACGKKFVSTTNTAFARTRKSAEAWRKFIEMTICGKSIAACAEECNICIQTAFVWRHKVLNAFVANQKSTKMSGNVEVDEMLIPISYKGNHVQGGFGVRKNEASANNDMPRKAYKRGTDNKSMSSKDKACVFCMVQNGSKAFYAAVPGVGFMNDAMLDATVARHVDKDNAMILADNYKVSQRYFETNGYAHTILLSNTSDNPKDHKPEIKDGLHLQHVNAMHHHIRNFLKPYYGVSSKYLENYTALFAWLKNIKSTKQRNSVQRVSLNRAATHDCYITGREIHERSAVPQCA